MRLFSYYCAIPLEIKIKRYFKITHIFSRAVCYLPREISGLATEKASIKLD